MMHGASNVPANVSLGNYTGAANTIWTQRLFHVFAARRSGQHALMWWLTAQLRAPVIRINDCTLPHTLTKRREPWPETDSEKPARAVFMNYEDKEPALARQLADQHIPLATGVEAEQTTYLLILRDPFNNLASKRQANPERSIDEARQEAGIWKALAREYLGDTRFLPNKINLNYNAWFASATYRETLSAALNLDYPVTSPAALAALQQVPGVGQSQFDKRRYHGLAQKMPVFDRWRQRLADPVYIDLFRDRELWDLSWRIFRNEGVSALMNLAAVNSTTDSTSRKLSTEVFPCT